jgi:hypothetical protein
MFDIVIAQRIVVATAIECRVWRGQEVPRKNFECWGEDCWVFVLSVCGMRPYVLNSRAHTGKERLMSLIQLLEKRYLRLDRWPFNVETEIGPNS